jgi:DnaJ-class molecular chaperone
VLSDPELRHKYNEFGQKNGGGMSEPAGGFQDPEEVFGKMFGGDRFDDLIGQISIGERYGTLAMMCDASVEVDPLSSTFCPQAIWLPR